MGFSGAARSLGRSPPMYCPPSGSCSIILSGAFLFFCLGLTLTNQISDFDGDGTPLLFDAWDDARALHNVGPGAMHNRQRARAAAQLRAVEAQFAKLDADSDGTVTKHELVAALGPDQARTVAEGHTGASGADREPHGNGDGEMQLAEIRKAHHAAEAERRHADEL